MHYEQYYQIATEQQFLDMGVEAMDLCTCRKLLQEPTIYENMRGLSEPFTTETGMMIRHLEFSNGYMQSMWARAVETQDFSMIPFKIEELQVILENEPSEEV